MLCIWERKEKLTSQEICIPEKKITNSFCRCQKWRPVRAERPNVAGGIFGFCHWHDTITIVIQLLQTAHNHSFLITLSDYLFGYPVPPDIIDHCQYYPVLTLISTVSPHFQYRAEKKNQVISIFARGLKNPKNTSHPPWKPCLGEKGTIHLFSQLKQWLRTFFSSEFNEKWDGAIKFCLRMP